MLDLKIIKNILWYLAIEAYKREISGTSTDNLYGQSECSEQTTGECGRILDLFIPIKHSSTSIEEEVDDKDDDDEEHQSHETDIDFDDKNMKSEWLKSVQLWNQSDAVVSNNRQVRFLFYFIFSLFTFVFLFALNYICCIVSKPAY